MITGAIAKVLSNRAPGLACSSGSFSSALPNASEAAPGGRITVERMP